MNEHDQQQRSSVPCCEGCGTTREDRHTADCLVDNAQKLGISPIQLAGRIRERMLLEQSPKGDLLTLDELEFMDLSAQLANVMGRIIGDGDSRHHDLSEAVDKIHQLQHTVMAQAAARAYPHLFRLLGGTVAGGAQ